MDEIIITHKDCNKRKMEREAHWEQAKKECFIEKPLKTFDECWHDMTKWVAFDPNHSYHSWLIFENFRDDYVKYPIKFQMKLLIDMYVHEVSMNLRKFNAVLRKIYKAETKEFKNDRTQMISKELETLNLVEFDENGREYITVYRGVNHKSASLDIAISWTYNIDKAKWFANRFACLHTDDRCCRVLHGKIYVKDILSIEHGRDEDEIIAFPRKVFDVLEVEDFVANY